MPDASDISVPLLYETHMHTPLCQHAEGTPDLYAKAALEKGLDGVIVTCHTPLPNGMAPRTRMTPEQWPDYLEMVSQAQERLAGVVDIRLGLECDYMPGLESWTEDLIEQNPLHYVLGSVHLTKEYRAIYDTGDWPALHRQYFVSLADAAETGYFDCLAHPDLAKNYGMDEYDLPSLMDTVRQQLDRIAATGIAMELNTSGLKKRGKEMNPAPDILNEMNKRDIPVVVGADAHHPDRVAADFPAAFDLLESVGYNRIHLFLNRTMRSISIQDARKKLSV